MDTLSISSGRPTLDITTRPAKVYIRNRRPVFRVRRSRPVMHVEKKAPSFKVNWLNVRAQTGIEYSSQISDKYNDEAFKRAMEAISQISRRSKNSMLLENRGNPIAGISKERISAAVRLNNAPRRIQNPQMEWDLGYFKVEWTDQQVEIEWDVSSTPEITVEPHVVEIRVRNNPAVRIRVNKDAVRNAVGVRIDKKI